MTDVNVALRYDANKKSILVAYLLWWLLGLFGGHRFYMGKGGSAAAMLIISLLSIPLMFVLIGFITIFITATWALVDAFMIPGWIREWNNRLVDALSPPAAYPA